MLSRRRLVRALLLLALALCVVGAIWFAVTLREVRAQQESARAFAQLTREQAEPFCALAARLERVAILDRPAGGADAGPLLNPRLMYVPLPFQRRGERTAAPEWVLEDAQLARLREDGWLHDLSGALPDTAWLERLHAFGHWSLLPGPVQQSAPVNPLEHSDVHGPSLLGWAKLHFAAALRAGTPAAASRDVQHLARLALTTGEPLTMSLGLALLSIDARAYAEAERRGLALEGWTPMREYQRSLLSRLSRAVWIFAVPATPTDIVERVRACDPTGLLRAGLLYEETSLLVMMRREQGGPLTARLEGLERALAAQDAKTDLQLVRAFWVRREDGSPAQADVELARALQWGLEDARERMPPPFSGFFIGWNRFALFRWETFMLAHSLEETSEQLRRAMQEAHEAAAGFPMQ